MDDEWDDCCADVVRPFSFINVSPKVSALYSFFRPLLCVVKKPRIY